MKNCLTPQNPKMCDPILVRLFKMRPHNSQSSCENATPSSSTSPLASYKEVTPPPVCINIIMIFQMIFFHICVVKKLITLLFRFIERFQSRGQHLCSFIGTKESTCMRKEFNSQRISLVHQHGRHFIVLEHQYGPRDVM